MEQCSPFSWVFYNNDEEGMMGELRQYLIQSRMELEATVLAAQEEIIKKDEELIHLKDVLMLIIKERDDALFKLQHLMLEKLLFQQQQQQQQQRQQFAKTYAVTNNNNNNCISTSSSESEDTSSIISPSHTNSHAMQHQKQPPPPPPPPPHSAMPPQIAATLAASGRPLPEKGKLLKAVMEAGPLLQTLLLAGPLPQWQHPPPQLDSIEIPLVGINPSNSPTKRGVDNMDCSTLINSPKYQRVV